MWALFERLGYLDAEGVGEGSHNLKARVAYLLFEHPDIGTMITGEVGELLLGGPRASLKFTRRDGPTCSSCA